MNTDISKIITKMIDESNGNLHDIEHFLKVYAYASAIGTGENLDPSSQMVLEAAAVLHDIACPLCRKKYGKAEGHMQELEGKSLAESFLIEIDMPKDFTERVVWLVSHHHTYSEVNLPEHQILLEADFLVNASESKYSKEHIYSAKRSFFRTVTGTALLDSIYLRQE